MKNVLTGIRPFGSLLAIAGHRTVSYVLQPIGVNSRNSCQKLCALRLCGKILCLSRKMANGAAGRLPRPTGATRQNQKSSFIAIFRFKGIQSYSKQFKAIQGFLETFFYFYVPPLRQRFTPLPNGASTFSGAWRLAPGAFAMGVFARFCANRCQAMPGYANLCQPPPSPYFLAHSHLSIPLILSILSKNLCFICAHLWLKNQTVF